MEQLVHQHPASPLFHLAPRYGTGGILLQAPTGGPYWYYHLGPACNGILARWYAHRQGSDRACVSLSGAAIVPADTSGLARMVIQRTPRRRPGCALTGEAACIFRRITGCARNGWKQ